MSQHSAVHPATPTTAGFDPHEIAKFDAMAARFWDPLGPFRPLHELNPLRVAFIERFGSVAKKRFLDIGCGGGLMSEALAQRGAEVVAIDLSASLIDTATMHALTQGLQIDYRHCSVEALLAASPASPARFDELVCLEMLEHVPDPAQLLKAFNPLLPIGGGLTLSTLNRTLRAYGVAILGAEYLLKRLPIGTHEYAKFIKPSELARALGRVGFEVTAIQGLSPKPFSTQMGYSDSVAINYLLRAVKRHDLR